MSNSLEERLKTHSTAFNGLLSLIPAKYYYDDATQDQWQSKKKSKKEAQQNKRAKLDPDSKDDADDYNNSHATAKDVMNNKAKNAKKVSIPSLNKFPASIIEKAGSDANNSEENNEQSSNESTNEDNKSNSDSDNTSVHEKESQKQVDDDDHIMNGNGSLVFDDDGNESSLHKERIIEPSNSITPSSAHTHPDATFAKQKKSKKELSPAEQQEKSEKLLKLREKLSSKINNLREKRKAPGTKNGAPVKSREQILAERKRKDELKRQEKLKRKHEEVEPESDSDEESDAEGTAEGDISKKVKDEEDNVLFGNIVFQDGSRVTSDLNRLRNTADKKKMKGPANRDVKAHLMKLEQKKRKLAELSPEEQAALKEKEKWQRVMSQAEGIKVKDDEKLLKKALKRKEKQKLKSEIEWKDRKQVVKDTVAARAKRREENLKSRRENKGKGKKNQAPKLRKFTGNVNKKAAKKGKGGANGANGANGSSGAGGSNGKKRAGFEGSAKSKGKGKGGK